MNSITRSKRLRHSMNWLSMIIGNPLTFYSVVIISIAWIVFGFVTHFEYHWSEITRVVIEFATFFTVFIIHFVTTADTRAEQSKLDELIIAVEGADKSKIEKEHELKGAR